VRGEGGDGLVSVAFDPDTHCVRISVSHVAYLGEVGGIHFDAPWRQLSIKMRVEKFDERFGFNMHVGKYQLILGPAFANHLPVEAQLDVAFDERKQQIYVLVNGKRTAEVTVLDDSWDKELSCGFIYGGSSSVLIEDVRIRVE